ncbi:hypothetical protein Trydic_g11102 [Trypoxylus dichotomus]
MRIKQKRGLQFYCRLAVCITFSVLLIIYFIQVLPTPEVEVLYVEDICLMPSINVDQKVIQYVNHELPRVECKRGVPPYVRQKSNTLSRILFKYINTTYLSCCYSKLVNRYGKLSADNYCKAFGKEIEVNTTYARVLCTYKNRLVYEDYFMFPPKANPKSKQKKPVLNRYNVLMLGLRAVSRINAYRIMSKFTNYLRYGLSAVEFSKYNAINFDTVHKESLRNIVPLYTGMTYEDVLEAYTRQALDSRDFIWNRFKQEGYKILLGEDCINEGIFRHKFLSKNIIADYSILPFMDIYENNTGNLANDGCYLCASSKLTYKIILDYYLTLAGFMRDSREKHFAMLWLNSLAVTNNPRRGINMPGIAVNDLKDFFYSLKRRGFLDDTIVFVISDRGYISTELNLIPQFVNEAKQPLLYISLPKQMKNRRANMAEKLKINTNKLVNAFDVHKTLETIMKLDTKTLKSKQPNPRKRTQGISLFNTVPHRFCYNIGINANACACKYIAKYVPKKIIKKVKTRYAAVLLKSQPSDKRCRIISLSFQKEIEKQTHQAYI